MTGVFSYCKSITLQKYEKSYKDYIIYNLFHHNIFGYDTHCPGYLVAD